MEETYPLKNKLSNCQLSNNAIQFSPKKQKDNEIEHCQTIGTQDINRLRREKTYQNPAKHTSKKAPEPLFWILSSLLGAQIIVAKIQPPTPFEKVFSLQTAPLLLKTGIKLSIKIRKPQINPITPYQVNTN